jgi:hypothetical protein
MNLPDNMLIPCPEINFNLRSIKICFNCNHYGSLSKPIVNGKQIEDCRPEEIQVICKRPVTRKLIQWMDE